VNRRRADKGLAAARSRRTDRYRDHGLLELFGVLAETQDRLSEFHTSASNDRRAFAQLIAGLDEVRDEIEARGICPYHQAALSVCCFA
jgi:hypothetical protein